MGDVPTRVLIVEDETLIRRALVDYLTFAGYEAEAAADGAQGLAIARSGQFGVILVDLRLPRLTGQEIISALRAEKPDLPVIVISGTGVLQDAIDAMRLGAWDYVAKPIHDMAEIGVVIERVLESARLRQQADRAAVLEERQRLARELHDSVTQSLYSVTLLAATVQRAATIGDTSTTEAHAGRLGEIAQQALKEMRLLLYELRPPVLKEEGLFAALQSRLDAVEGRAGIETKLLVESEIELPIAIQEAFYRIALEALNNALKHAAATAVTVRVDTHDEQARLMVEDNGRGFDPKAVRDTGGMGLETMHERAKKLGGTMAIQSSPGKGTIISVLLKNDKQ